MGQSKKQEVLTKKMNYRKTMTKEQKQKHRENKRVKYQAVNVSHIIPDIDTYIEEFKKQVKAGPFYICCVCNRTLYKKSVIILQANKYSSKDYFMIQNSFDGKEYICKTCHAKLLKGQLPAQAVVNNLFVDESPTELSALEKLEQILVAQRIVSEKVIYNAKRPTKKN